MNTLTQFIKESYEDYLVLSSKDKKKLLDLDLEYGELMLIARYETIVREITNKDEEYEKFKELYIDKHIKYFPKLKYKKLRYKEYNLEERARMLLNEFRKLNCFLSKYYIKNLTRILFKIEYLENIDNKDYDDQDELDRRLYAFNDNTLDTALNMLRKNPYKLPNEKKYEKYITAQEASEIIKKNLDKYGYDWEIIMKPNMLPRMGVNPEKTFRISKNAKFSDIDIKSLIAHEIKAHVAKRYWGYQTGLFLFVFGLNGKNEFDEGLAIWNTFNIIDEPKANALFKIALPYVASYYCIKYDFCEAFDKLKELVGNPDYNDKNIFAQLLRSKRSVLRTDKLGYWSGDIDYLNGYLSVSKMTAKERDDILKYNIGPEQFFELPTIKKFLEKNKFKPISNTRLNKIKKKYEFF